MRVAERVWGGRPHRALWGFIRGRTQGVEARWFWSRFLDAATVVVERFAPWPAARRLVAGRPLGAWLLVAVWTAVPLLLLRVVARDLGLGR